MENKNTLTHQEGIYQQMLTLNASLLIPSNDPNVKTYAVGFENLKLRLVDFAEEIQKTFPSMSFENKVDQTAWDITYSRAVMKLSEAVFGFLPLSTDTTTKKEEEDIDDFCKRYLDKYIAEARKIINDFKAPSVLKAEKKKREEELNAKLKKAKAEREAKAAKKKLEDEAKKKLEIAVEENKEQEAAIISNSLTA